METFSREISIAELTALLFIVSLTLIPLTIWGVWYLEQRRLAIRSRRSEAFSLQVS
jgi:hypothetical protein